MTAPRPAEDDDALLEALVEDDAWGAPEALLARAQAAAEAALRAAGVSPEDVCISALFTSDAAIAHLNGTFRGKPKPTNVLSWPAFPLAPPAPGAAPPRPPVMQGARTPIGDIALAAGVVRAESAAQKLEVDAHVAHLVAHGVLHLLGYDHETDEDAAVMEGLERVALAELGIADPYA